MSKTLRFICLFVLAFVASSTVARASTTDVKVTVDGMIATVEGRAGGARSHLVFQTSYAGVNALAERVGGLSLRDADGGAVSFENSGNGVFTAARPFVSWTYRVDLKPASQSAVAHVSWLSGETGVVFGGDLLPQSDEPASARIQFVLPTEWSVASVEKRLSPTTFDTPDADRAVFIVGRGLRETTIDAQTARLNLVMTGEWQVPDTEAAAMAREIFEFYARMFAATPVPRVQIFLGRFPGEVKAGRWEAETRGANVTIFSSELSFKTQSEQRLHEQLRHEILHLWLPNGINLSGNYDWFFEGFALYESLKTAVLLKRIRFDDFLDTLARAHAVDTLQSARGSLLEASKVRWSGANTQVYARGMLVAFLTDLVILRDSKSRDSLENLLRELNVRHRFPAARADGNDAVMSLLTSREGVRPIVDRYVRGKADIDWQTELNAAGIESRSETAATKLTVRTKLNGRQKDLLNKLGYNEWRKKSD